jgi:nucleoside-diphosphate-sugar epimerase
MLKIIGNGLIAKSLKKKLTTDRFEIFASGVSNSNEDLKTEFNREIEMIITFIKDRDINKNIIYFSTYSIYDSSLINSKYVEHKLKIERLLKGVNNSLIIRLPNIVGVGGNPNTMFNYFKETINNNEQITILKNAYRNIIDVDDVSCFINNLDDKHPKIINFIHPISYNVIDIVKKIQISLNKKNIVKKIEGGENYIGLPSDYTLQIMKKCNIDLKETYIDNIIKKYKK